MASFSTMSASIVKKDKNKESKWKEHTWSKYLVNFSNFSNFFHKQVIRFFLDLISFFFYSYSKRYCSSWIESSLLIFGLFLIFLALAPNFSVEIVSSRLYLAGLQVIIKLVLAFPPKDS